MAEDFYVTFGSNADTWANGLKNELQPAHDAIFELLGQMGKLVQASNAPNFQKALAKVASGSSGGSGVGGEAKIEFGGLQRAIDDTHENVADLRRQLGTLVTAFSKIEGTLAALPAAITRAKQGIASAEQGSYRNVQGGRYASKNEPGAIPAQAYDLLVRRTQEEIRKASNPGISTAGVRAGERPLPAPAIGRISTSKLDQAGFDRVVKAINEQTAVLKNGLRVSGKGSSSEVEATPVPKGKKSQTAAAAAEAAQEAEVTTEELAQLESQIQGMVKVLKAAGQGSSEAATKLKEERDQLAAVIRERERKETGITRTEQGERARREYAAEQKAKPVLTDVERDSRLARAALINSPGASDFDDRLSRARTKRGGNYSREDLQDMAREFNALGIEITGIAKKTKAELATALKSAYATYRERHPEGHEDLRTEGFSITKTTQIGSELKALVGDIEEAAQRIAKAREIVTADRRSGGTGTDDLRRGTKLGMTYGASTGQVPGLFTREQLQAAEKDLGPAFGKRAEEAFSRAAVLAATDSTFDPYDPRHSSSIKAGSTPEEKARAAAASQMLRDMRSATTELDRMGQEFLDLQKAIRENAAFISRASGRIRKGRPFDDDEERLAQAREIAKQRGTEFAEMRSRLGPLAQIFNTDAYRQGLTTRERGYATLGEPLRNGEPVLRGTRHQYEARRDSPRERTLSDYRALQGGILDALTGAGARNGIKPIPGLVRNARGIGFADGFYETTNGGSSKGRERVEEKLNRALDSYTAKLESHRNSLANSELDPQAIDQSFKELEHAADVLTGRLHRAFKTSPTLSSLLRPGDGSTFSMEGYEPSSDDIAKREAMRQADRDRTAADAKRKQSKRTPQEELSLAESTLADVTKGATEARKESRKAEKALAKAEKDNADALAQMTPEQRALMKQHKRAARDQAAADHRYINAQIGLEKQGNRPSMFSDPSGSMAWDAERQRLVARRESGDARSKRLGSQVSRLEDSQAADPIATALLKAQRTAAIAAASVEQFVRATQRAQGNVDRLTKEIDSVREAASRGLSRKQIAEETGVSAAGIKSILGPAGKRGSGAAQEAVEVVKTTKATNDKVAALKAERAELQKTPHTGIKDLRKAATAAEAAVSGKQLGALKGAVTRATNKGDIEGAAAAQKVLDTRLEEAKTARALADSAAAASQRLRAIKKELNELGAGRGSGRGKPPVDGSGGGSGSSGAGKGAGGDHNILAQILAELKNVHGTLRKGVPTIGSTRAAQADADSKTPTGRMTKAKMLEYAQLGVPENERDQEKLRQAGEYQTKLWERRSQKRRDKDVDAAYGENERVNKGIAKEAENADRALREQARAQQAVADASIHLSSATQAEIAKLRELTAAASKAATAEERLAAQKKIASQQTRVAESANRDLKQQQILAPGRKQSIRTILSDAGPKTSAAEMDSIMAGIRQSAAGSGPGGGSFRRGGEDWGEEMGYGAMDGFARIFGGGGSFWERIMHTTGTFVVRNFAAGFVFGLTNAMQEIMSQALQAEATFVRVSDALESTNKDVGDLRSSLAGMSSEYGVALNDTYTTAASLTGLFSNVEDLKAATRISTQLQTISNGALNATEAVGVLASTMSAFEMRDSSGGALTEIEKAQKIADVLTSVQNNLGVNLETTAEGVASIAGLANQMKIEWEESAVIVAAISKQTNQTGAASGEQVGRILAAMQTGSGKRAIEESFGSEVSGLVDAGEYGDAIVEMMKSWDSLTQSQQQNVSTTLAGQRNMRAWIALMNGADMNLRALGKALNSEGEAADRMDAIMRNLQNRIRALGSTLQGLVDQIIQTGILNIVGVALVATTHLLRTITDGLEWINEFADNHPFIGFLRDVAGFAVGAAIAIKLLGVAITGMRGAMSGMALRGGAGQMRPATIARPPVYATGTMNPASGRDIPRRGFDASRGLILGTGQRALGPGVAGLGRAMDYTTRRMGKWADGFAPRGRFSAPLYEWGQRTARRGETRLRNVENARTLATNRPPSLFGNPEGALRHFEANSAALTNSAQAAERSTRSMTASGRAMTGIGRASQGLGRAMGGLSSGLSALGRSGIMADLAIGALAIGIFDMVNTAKESARMGESADRTFKALVPKSRNNSNNEEDGEKYVSEARDSLTKSVEDKLNSAANSNFLMDMGSAFADWTSLTITNAGESIRGALTGNFAGNFDYTSIQDKSNREWGIDSNTGTFAGKEESMKLRNQMFGHGGKNIFSMDSLDELESERDRYDAEIDRMAKDVRAKYQDGKLSGEQYSSWMAELAEADNVIKDQISNRIAVLKGFKAGTALSIPQMAELAETVRLLREVGSNPVLSTMGGQGGGVQIAAHLKDRIDQLKEGSELQKELLKLLGPAGDPSTGGYLTDRSLITDPSSFYGLTPEQLLARPLPDQVDFARAGVIEAEDRYRSALLEVDNAKSDDAIKEAKEARDQAFADYMSSVSSLADAIRNEGSLDAQYATDTGDLDGAVDIQIKALKKTEKVFKDNNQSVAFALKQAMDTRNEIAKRAKELASSTGDAFDPGNQIDIKAQQYNDPNSGMKKTLDSNVSRIREMLYGSGAGDQVAQFQAIIQGVILSETADISMQIAQASSAEAKAELEVKLQEIISNILATFDAGKTGWGVPSRLSKLHGPAAVTQEQSTQSQVDLIGARKALLDAQEADAASLRSAQASLRQAQLGVTQAYADARGDAVASAKVQVAMARAAISAAQAELAAAKTAAETANARAALLGAQAQLVGALAAVDSAQQDLIQSRFDVAIALAEAAGKNVLAAKETLAQARQALSAALKKSGGKNTAEVNAARVGAIQAQAALRDARLQDDLDTIDFNLEMGKITQSSAIAALQEILRTRDLTRDQRRQLMLQIKGMKDELSDSQWNFGGIALPTPYQMRRYIQNEKNEALGRSEVRHGAWSANPGGAGGIGKQNGIAVGPQDNRSTTTTNNTNVNISVNGADTAKVKKIIQEVVGGRTNTKTTGARRGR